MKKLILPAFALLSIISCNNEQPDKEATVIIQNAPVVSADIAGSALKAISTVNPPADISKTTAQPIPVPQQITTVPSTKAMPVQNNSNVKTVAGLNPVHGQPGHRCDISVGAPLNSPATKPQAPAATMSQPVMIPQQTSAANGTAGVNPPHGQPGHKCDVGANANLSTGAAKTVTPTAPALQGVPVMQQNAGSNAATLSTGSNAKLNPAHGQPGHDCKVAVGQPLK